MEPTDLFVYGTLMDPELVRSLTGKTFPAQPARLPGFRRLQQPGGYPYILQSAEDVVDGVILRGIDGETLQILDRYEAEGELYLRVAVVAETDRGQCPCAAYVGKPEAFRGAIDA